MVGNERLGGAAFELMINRPMNAKYIHISRNLTSCFHAKTIILECLGFRARSVHDPSEDGHQEVWGASPSKEPQRLHDSQGFVDWQGEESLIIVFVLS